MMLDSRNSELLLPALSLLVIAAFVAFVYWDSVEALLALWGTSSHQHGFLVFPISAYLVWRLLPEVRSKALRFEPLGLLAVATVVGAWIIARLAGIQIIEQACVLALVPTVFFAVAGREMTAKLLFPIVFIFAALPVGDTLVPILMSVTADISAVLLRLSGIPMLRDGQHMTLPGGSFVVAEVCSGLRYLMSGAILAVLFSYLNYSSMRKRVVFIVITCGVLVFANGVRAYLIMAIASATNMRYLAGADHVYFGWALFGVVIMLMMWIGMRFADTAVEAVEAETGRPRISAGLSGASLVAVLVLAMLVATLNPLQSEAVSLGKAVLGLLILVFAMYVAARRQNPDKETESTDGRSVASIDVRSVAFVAATALLLVAGPSSVAAIQRAAPAVASVPDIAQIEGCDFLAAWNLEWMPKMRNAAVEDSAMLECDDRRVNIYAAGYAGASQGSELVSGSNRLVPKSLLRSAQVSTRPFVSSDGQQRRARELVVDRRDERLLMWYWYEVDGFRSSSPYVVKALQVWALLRHRPAGGHVVLLALPIESGVDMARGEIGQVAAQLDEAPVSFAGSDRNHTQ